VLRCVALCCVALCYAVLRCAVLRCAVLCCAVLLCVALCCAVSRCVALCCAVLRVTHKKTAHDSAARIGNKKAALGGLIGFYKVKCSVTRIANPTSLIMRSIVSASIGAPLFRAPSAVLQNLLFPIRAGKRTADCVNSLAIN